VTAYNGENPEMAGGTGQADSLQRSVSFTGVADLQDLLLKKKSKFDSPLSDRQRSGNMPPMILFDEENDLLSTKAVST
jgi:hypothetical protein